MVVVVAAGGGGGPGSVTRVVGIGPAMLMVRVPPLSMLPGAARAAGAMTRAMAAMGLIMSIMSFLLSLVVSSNKIYKGGRLAGFLYLGRRYSRRCHGGVKALVRLPLLFVAM